MFAMPTLPIELITEILLRLPVKSLLQFRSVSKSWFALISSAEFVKTHLNISGKKHNVILTGLINAFTSRETQYVLRDYSLSSLCNDDCVIEAFDLDYPMSSPQQYVSIVGSVNGLICLMINEVDLVLWNPSIRKFKKLPDSRLKDKVTGGNQCDIPKGVCVVYGFGYDESSDDYKVVGCIEDRINLVPQAEVEIYSLKSDSWRSKDDVPDGVLLSKPCKCVNGKLHWINNNKESNIISFDLADEKWGKVELPRYREGNLFLDLKVLGSDLCVFCNYMEIHADVWVMRDYGVKESWTKMYSVKYPDRFFSPFISRTLCMSNKGEVLLVPGSTLMVHNPEDEPIRYPKVTNFDFCVAMNIYIESLVSPPLQNELSKEQE
ncbi:hypothetical protein T459_07968 [Capsicum annuum]|uniref:F-box domain-containing protein n=1 Tax=Capsicum annuum TaxID=4072 RepID=A0A1U8GCZ0_CAPAN|nr:putative early light-induced protein, chloroplastic-like [Capsicum annuum]PHT85862.1 hypothetical protein T459_07968 [Capsicum annuum]